MGRLNARIALAGLTAMLVSGAARSDVPRLELSVGMWDHKTAGIADSDDALLDIQEGFELTGDREPYGRLGLRLGNQWWTPVIRARYSALSGEGSSFVDDSQFIGNVLINLDTTSRRTEVDFGHLEGLLYFTVGERVRAEFGGGVKRFDGLIETVQVRNTSLNGEVTTRAQSELPASVRVFYGAAYAEPATWLTFGGEAVSGSEAGVDVLDLAVRFIVKPLTSVGLEGGYRRMTMAGENADNTRYDFEFGGPYAGLSLLYGSKDAGLAQPDTDGDGVHDKDDQCADTPEGAPVNESGCEPDADGDGVPDRRDDCADTSADATVDDKGCPPATAAAATPVAEPLDADQDGLADDRDQCPDTPAGATVDANGCMQGDADQDGVADEQDRCPGGAYGAVDAAGCPLATTEAAPAPIGPDEDQDGVPDADDRCRRTPRGFKVDATGCLTRQATVLQGITFQVNSSYLMRDSEVLLHEVVEALKAQKTSKIVIQGHTCDLGEAKYNKWLSQRRANRVLEFLVRHGIDGGRLLAVGYGEEQPLVPNDDEKMRELNRRTVFQVIEQ